MQHDSEKKIIIKTDTSDYAISMRMTQLGDNGKPRLIIFYLKKLVQAELNYDIHNKELLVIVVVFKTMKSLPRRSKIYYYYKNKL